MGLFFTFPIVTFATNSQKSILNTNLVSPTHISELNSEEKNKYIEHLQNEGAISTNEAEGLLRNEAGKPPLEIHTNINSSSPSSKVLTLDKKEEIKVQYQESASLVNLKLLNIDQIIKSDIIKVDSGWQITLQLSDDREIDISDIPKSTNYISDININKFNGSIYILRIIGNKRYRTQKPIIKKGKPIGIEINLSPTKSSKIRKFNIPFLNRFKKRNSVYNYQNSALPPPLGDIAAGSVVLQNRGFIKLDGPKISLTLNNASAKDALMRLSKLGGYGFVLANELKENQSNSTSPSEKLDNSQNVTLSFIDEDYSIAFNSILLASGLQAKRNDNLIIVGNNVLGKSFGPKLSKVYRLNQASASSAADYLATLGASISKVDTVSGSSAGNGASTPGDGVSYKYIDSYSASSGPLIGLIGTTDSRLQTITLVGSSELILIAEKYLKQLDLRQRQVALSVKILDVELSNSDSINNDFAFRTGSTFIVNEKGKLFSAFGNFIPPALSAGSPLETRQYTQERTQESGINDPKANIANTDVVKNTLTTSLTPNPGWQYTANELYNFLVAQIKSSSTKVLANPTLILSESTEKIQGGAEVIGDMSSGKATIGRPFANESFVTLGTNVISDYKTSTSEEGGITTCEAEFSTAGLTFGARVNKIDDNGYVTFSLSPKLTSVSEIIDIPNCGPINILSVRRLDTGTLRVRDSQTLILTGVISDLDSEVITKTPILGDIPILGRLFRSTAGSRRKSELIILVTPKIIDDSESNTFGVGYNPTVEDSKKLINENL